MEKAFSSNRNDDLFADFTDCKISRIHSLANQPEAKNSHKLKRERDQFCNLDSNKI